MAHKHRALTRYGLILMLFIFTSAEAKEIPPLETLKGPIDQILSILNDSAYKGAEKRTEQRDKIWKIASPVFSFDAMSRLAIGKSWKKFSADEKARFTTVFSKFLRSTYIDKLQGEFNNEQILFDKELVKGSKALVRTRLRRQNLEIPIDYRMLQINGTWRVYDILLDNGVSIVKNYRIQFASMLKNGTPSQLIKRLEEKLANQNNKVSN